jgi:SET domain
LQWGFGCVRSRALQLGASVFGMVPFADVANHADDPSADIKIVPADSSSSAGGGSSSSSSTGGYVQLVARRAVAPGDEVSISYSGTSGHTNQRWMAQYGFAPAGGNAADRLTLVVPDG